MPPDLSEAVREPEQDCAIAAFASVLNPKHFSRNNGANGVLVETLVLRRSTIRDDQINP